MARRILKCVNCGSYTMKEEHCSKKTINPKPAKYSPEDKYQEYRLKYKNLAKV
ncbi:ribosome biogenesis protein [Candidatus Woesearchaeota archaeon]|nr:ribosome biogenesis protein [Candidatus Woesearchaeota archaeon]